MSTTAAAAPPPLAPDHFFPDGLDDVEEFVCANEGEQSISWDRLHQVLEFVKIGNRSYRQDRYEEAINCYSKANSIKPGDPIILGNRAAAYIRISRFLRSRPPSASEYSPLNGLDPTIHAELALKDSEKVMNIRSNFLKSYMLKANALILLEKYELARDVILSGFQVDPLSNPLRTLLQILERTYSTSSAERNKGRPERFDDFDCTLCLKLLYDPITTPCGHTFCRSCVFQSMDRSNKCPLCRTVLFITTRTCAISVTLNNIIQKTFPEEYAERKLEHESLTNLGVDLIPLFVMDAVLPCQKFPLNIFEPRYRLMVRRIMEGNHRMGMVIVDSSTGDIADFACEVEITECEPLPDGRFYIEVEGRRRFRILRSWDQDGYRVAEVEWIRDTSPPEGTKEKLDLQELTRNAAEYAQAWMTRAKEAARQDRRRLVEILNAEVMIPTTEDPERFSFWLTTLSKRRPSERLELLRLRDTKEFRSSEAQLADFEASSSLQGGTFSSSSSMILGGGGWRVRASSMPEPVFSFIRIIFLIIAAVKADNTFSSAATSFTPQDNILLSCGSLVDKKLADGRTFESDPQSAMYLNTDEDVKVTVNSIPNNDSSPSLPLFLSARIFPSEAVYEFPLSGRGLHFIRLYFYPLPQRAYNLSTAVFRVTTDDFVLLHDFSVRNLTTVCKEYLLNVTMERLTLRFSPKRNSLAFINAIEIVSAPNSLLSDTAAAVSLSPVSTFSGLLTYAFEVSYRLNVGGPFVSMTNDSLSRTWMPDKDFMIFPQGAQSVWINPSFVSYPDGGATLYIAPNWVYATAADMANSGTTQQNFNLTWKMPVDPSYSYLVRLHFCDIVSTSLNDLYFNVYVNGLMGVSALDLSSLTQALATAYYKDFVLNSTAITDGSVMIQVGPDPAGTASSNAILNGLEVIKMSNSAGSLDGLFDVNGDYVFSGRESKWGAMKVAAAAGLAMAATALLLVGSTMIRWQKKRPPQDWKRGKSFSSWLLPAALSLSCSHTSLLSSSKTSSRASAAGHGFFFRRSSTIGITNAGGAGRFFTFSELQEATGNFSESMVIGVGGVGKVYLGQLQEDGTKLAIKRGNPKSEQGINEFQTEIQLLSQLRHRHLVSLIGYCDEGNEMILVYEYMANGVLREHLYGSSSSKLPLTWKQRLEICIGAARGLHYLHTGAAHCIIHRDVKTTNILLDESFVAKVSDFGLSKATAAAGGLMEDITHVSTVVKGSFGYLDPEYFRRQQLTLKSDVYSFGVVLIEVLCARPAINPALTRDRVNLAEWAMTSYRKGLLDKIIDPYLVGTINVGSLNKYVEAAEKCLAEHGVDRPSMGDVLWNLESALHLHEAASQLEPPTELDIDANTPTKMSTKDLTSCSTCGDDSGLTISAFSQILGNFHGR
ncbi:hypothetical protein Dimus_004946 [Dionaea muscipula]